MTTNVRTPPIPLAGIFYVGPWDAMKPSYVIRYVPYAPTVVACTCCLGRPSMGLPEKRSL